MKKKSSVICGSEDASKDFFIQIYNGVGIDLRFEGIKYHDISGVFKCGQLSAIMGPSGAGKSSLLNILAGYRSKNVSGDIYVNDHERNPQEFRKITSYIMQDDLLLPHLSVEETMTCSANLKLCEKSDADTKGKIVSVLCLLNIERT
ncbi:unnamed protein product [Dicrocoelium dendriticum]|nr:unnamed protein product [Dicrocoelium dendriticum]